MASRLPSDVTAILHDLHAGEPGAQTRLLARVYDDLRRMARGFMRGERANHSWQATDLVHEAIPRLLGSEALTQNRKHFFAAAARTMREILIEHSRRRSAAKRGGGWKRVPLDDVADYFEQQQLDVSALHEALDRLAAFNGRQSQAITFFYFCRFSAEEIARLLDISLSTVESDLRLAKAWLHSQLADTKT